MGELAWKRFALGFGAGFQIYPDAEERVREHFHYGSSVELDATSTNVQIYIGVNLLWYLA